MVPQDHCQCTDTLHCSPSNITTCLFCWNDCWRSVDMCDSAYKSPYDSVCDLLHKVVCNLIFNWLIIGVQRIIKTLNTLYANCARNCMAIYTQNRTHVLVRISVRFAAHQMAIRFSVGWENKVSKHNTILQTNLRSNPQIPVQIRAWDLGHLSTRKANMMFPVIWRQKLSSVKRDWVQFKKEMGADLYHMGNHMCSNSRGIVRNRHRSKQYVPRKSFDVLQC
jgi:hypothetical protein